ncbi:type II secretion system F family protein [Jeongeupia sp. USM3]|uniref:type II secretion system F family protein n=1 Tax=Jeongeupia sp. USM3 TaxID=1906741 RepID=UPI00089DE021|nr:type II secretion system F family protein [Jeongeupia sp. USM3]AOY01203.1 hypothetical protein BJP62_12570 [Jeongeupia sp. USM3]
MLSLLVLLGLACLIAAAGCLVSHRRRTRLAELRLARQGHAEPNFEPEAGRQRRWQMWLQARRAELPAYWGYWLLLPCMLAMAAQLSWKGASGLVVLVLGFAVLVAAQNFRIDAQRQRALRQLPSFLEGLARLASIGQSLPQAFGKLAAETPSPLGEMVVRAQNMHASGMELDAALHQNATLYKIPEFNLLAAAMRVALRYGGQPEKLVNRIALVLQARHASHQELMALTAEVRLSAWVLGGLPAVLGIAMTLLNRQYMAVLFREPVGQKMLIAVIVMQLVGGFLLYRLAKRV